MKKSRSENIKLIISREHACSGIFDCFDGSCPIQEECDAWFGPSNNLKRQCTEDDVKILAKKILKKEKFKEIKKL